MKLNSELNRETLEYFYKEHKNLVTPIIAIVISIVLILFFLIPQVTSFPAKKTEADLEAEKLRKLNEVKLILESTNLNTLESDISLSTQAVPIERNFEYIIRAMTQAADRSGVEIENYSFKSSGEDQTLTQGFPRVDFTLNLSADESEILTFTREIQKTLPISEVVSIDYSSTNATLLILFYYKPLEASSVADRTQIRALTSEERSSLNEIGSWEISVNQEVELGDSSESAEIQTDSSPF